MLINMFVFKTLSLLDHLSVAILCCNRFLSFSIFEDFSSSQVLNYELMAFSILIDLDP